MKQSYKIYVDRIRDGETESISEQLQPDFMQVHEKEMRFADPITFSGEAYVTDNWLIVRLKVATKVQLTCSVCNETFTFSIDIPDMVHEEPIENIRDKVFDLLPTVRENILLEVPFYPQCGITKCQNRSSIEPFLKKEHGHNPFKELL